MEIFVTVGDITLSPTLTTSILVYLLLITFFLFCSVKIKKSNPKVPSIGFMAVLELVFNCVNKFTEGNIKNNASRYVTFIITIGSYLALANIVGLFGFTPPVTNLSITLGLTLVSLGYIIFSGIKTKGILTYVKDTYIGDVPKPMLILFIPVNLIGEISKIISLTFRLFGNVVSGVLIISLVMQFLVFVFELMPVIGWIPSLTLPLLNAYFDVFAGLMQTFIFCTLTLVFMKAAVE